MRWLMFIMLLLPGLAKSQADSTFGDYAKYDAHLLDHLKARARKSGQYILIYFNSPSCPQCLNMEEGPLTDPRIVEYIKSYYVLIKLNGRTDFNGIELSQRFNLSYYPTIAVLNRNGELMELIEGYTDVDSLLERLSKWKGKRKAPF